MIRISFHIEPRWPRPKPSKISVWVGVLTAISSFSLVGFVSLNEPPVQASKTPPAASTNCADDTSSLLNTLESPTISDFHLMCETRVKDFSPLHMHALNFDRDRILDDYQSRISEDFQIPDSLRKRVGFWFDVYTRYPSYVKILHNSQYPWIIYRKFDLTDFLVSPKVEWMNVEAAEHFLARERADLIHELLHMAKARNSRHFTADEKYLADLLAEVPGPRRRVYREAAHSVRVQTGQMDFFIQGLQRQGQYRDAMADLFDQHGLPSELTLIPLVESSFNPKAESRIGAAGIWQFMEPTARHIMVLNDRIDERRSPIKSTMGAARYLKFNYRALYHSWPLAVMAFNNGPTSLRRLVQHTRTKDAAELINKHQTRAFSFASRNYYPEFLAAVYAERYQRQIFGPIRQLASVKDEPIVLHHRFRPQKIAKITNLPLKVLLSYNLDLQRAVRHNSPLPVGYVLHLPVGYSDAFSTMNVAPAARRRKRGHKYAVIN